MSAVEKSPSNNTTKTEPEEKVKVKFENGLDLSGKLIVKVNIYPHFLGYFLFI